MPNFSMEMVTGSLVINQLEDVSRNAPVPLHKGKFYGSMGALLQRRMKRYRYLEEERCNQIYPTPQCNLGLMHPTLIERSPRFCYVTSLASLTRPFINDHKHNWFF